MQSKTRENETEFFTNTIQKGKMKVNATVVRN